jgi:hypothetical protein
MCPWCFYLVWCWGFWSRLAQKELFDFCKHKFSYEIFTNLAVMGKKTQLILPKTCEKNAALQHRR